MSAYSQEHLLQVLRYPHISEKATYVADKQGQVIFVVAADATKPQIKSAVEAFLNVKVKSVQVSNLKGKVKRVGRHTGTRKDIKKAYICLEPGQDIDLVSGGIK